MDSATLQLVAYPQRLGLAIRFRVALTLPFGNSVLIRSGSKATVAKRALQYVHQKIDAL